MIPDLTLEVIYLKESTDFKMEFDICGLCNIRFLSHITHNKQTFLSALAKGVTRSRVVVAVGSFNPLDEEYLPSIVGKAAGYNLKTVEKALYEISSELEYSLPQGAIPLVSTKGILGGCVMENNDQAIILLTADREVRHEILKTLVCPYLEMISGQKPIKNKISSSQTAPLWEENVTENTQTAVAVAEKTKQEEEIEVEEAPFEQEEEELFVATESLSNEQPFVVLEQPKETQDLEYKITEKAKEKTERAVSKRHVVRAVISVTLVLFVLLAAYFGYDFVYQPMQYSSVHKETLSLYGQTWHNLPENMIYKFGKLYQANKDVVGWLSIPETTINMPIVSSAKRTDSHYKTHLFDGSISSYGTPFTYSKIGEDTYSRNIVIYGKGDGIRGGFSELKEFLSEEKYLSAPVFSFDTIYLESKYKIISVYAASKEKSTAEIETSFFDDAAFLSYAEKEISKSQIKTNSSINREDDLLTLVSEGKKENIILVARRVRDGENPLVSTDPTDKEPDKENTSSEAESTSSKPLQEIEEETSSKVTTSENLVSSQTKDQTQNEQTLPEASVPEIKPNTPQVTPPAGGSEETPSEVPLENLPMFTVKNSLNGEIFTAPANEIIAQILEAEMGSHYHIEALKAQAVAAYSWLLCSGAATGATPSAPLKVPKANAINAANAVAGKVVLYDGKVAQTAYHGSSAGHTANSEDIWSSRIPYLVSVDSSVDKNAPKYQTIITYSSVDLAAKVREATGIDLNKISDKNQWFKCTYDENGVYVKTINIGGTVKKGTYFRTDILKYSIRSSAYTISYNSLDDKFTIVVKGNGHGVGMSQTGANAYANSGWTYEQILKHYYKGTTLGTYF